MCIWNISLLLLTCFCSRVLQLKTQLLNVLAVSLSKVLHKLKILGGGDLNRINQWGGTAKKRGPDFEISARGSKRRGRHDFWLKFSRGKILEETMQWKQSTKHHSFSLQTWSQYKWNLLVCFFVVFVCVYVCVCFVQSFVTEI